MDKAGDVFEDAQHEVTLEHSLRALEKRFFKDIEPLKGIKLVRDVDFPARYLPEEKIIELHRNVAQFPKLSQFLIVHELIHHKLSLKSARHAEIPYSGAYRDEIRKLCNDDAYVALL